MCVCVCVCARVPVFCGLCPTRSMSMCVCVWRSCAGRSGFVRLCLCLSLCVCVCGLLHILIYTQCVAYLCCMCFCGFPLVQKCRPISDAGLRAAVQSRLAWTDASKYRYPQTWRFSPFGQVRMVPSTRRTPNRNFRRGACSCRSPPPPPWLMAPGIRRGSRT